MTSVEPRQEDVQATFCATVVDEWIRLGVRNAFVAPGSRSTPMAIALASRPELRVEIVHDERSAGFMALGSGLATGTAAVALCTSGTAATHFHAAVVEAGLSGVPMIVCTADRPAELQGICSPQTIDQENLYGGAARAYLNPGVPNWSERSTWRTLADRVYFTTLGLNPGAVQLNLQFREPLVGRVLVDDIPAAGAASTSVTENRPRPDASEVVEICRNKVGVIVAGEGAAGSKQIVQLSEALGWPIIADSRSGLQHVGTAVTHADAFLRNEEFASTLSAEVVLQFGEGPASKILNNFLHGGRGTVVQVSNRTERRDPYRDVAITLIGDFSKIAQAIKRALPGETPERCKENLQRWLHADAVASDAINSAIGETLGEPAVAVELASNLRKGSIAVVSSSMPVRDLEWYAKVPKAARVVANRGANGIDGVVSTAIGAAASVASMVYVLVGDVALLHDSSALTALAGRDLNLRIVVVDNDGGAIFSFLQQRQELELERFEQLFGTPHGTDIVKLCKAHGLATRKVNSRSELSRALKGKGIRVIVVSSERDLNRQVHAMINEKVSEAVKNL